MQLDEPPLGADGVVGSQDQRTEIIDLARDAVRSVVGPAPQCTYLSSSPHVALPHRLQAQA